MKKKLLITGISLLGMLISTKGFAQIPVADFSVSQNTTCVGTVLQITDLSSDSPTSWSYTVQGTAGVITSQNFTVNFNTPGEYEIDLEATNASGTSAPFSQTITVNDLPTISINPTLPICFGNSVTLLASGATTYTWSNAIANGASISPSVTTLYTVSATDLNGCVNMATHEVTVNPLPTLSIAGNTAVCAGALISQTVSGADSYLWNDGSSNDYFTASPLVSTTYTVIGFDALTSCSNTATRFITVNALPTISVTSGAICLGDIYTIIPSGASTYTFSNGSNTVSPTSNTSYSVSGTSIDGCVSASTAVSNVTVNVLPTVAVTSGSICSGNIYTMIASGASTYTFSNGSNTVAPVANTSYSVVGTSVEGCLSSNTAVSDVTVVALPTVAVTSGSICFGDAFTMIASGATTYTFSSGSNIVSPISNTSYSVTGSSIEGCHSSNTAISTITVFALPIISVNSGNICTGNSFTMVPTGASTYTFSNGSNTVAPISNASYSVTGTSTAGCLSLNAAVANITVSALPTISVNSGTICAGSTYTMIASGASTYTFSNGSNTVAPIANASYSVTGTDANGCVSSNVAIANITVSALPTVAVTSASLCAGSVYTMIASGAATYTFSNGSNTVAPISNASYSVSGTDANGCVSSNIAISNLTVFALPIISVNSGTICSGSSFTLLPSGASSYTFSSGSDVITQPAMTNTYSIIGTNLNGCLTAAPAIATVVVASGVTVNVTGVNAICIGNTASLSASGANTYQWDNGASSSTIALSPSVTTIYTVTGVIGTCSSSAVVSVSVNSLPTLTIASSSAIICNTESTTLTANGATSYSWNVPGNTNIIVITPSITTNYTVTGTDANGCSNTAAYTQSVSECTGITNTSNNSIDFIIYPNPSNGEIKINVNQVSSITILNSIGQIIYTQNLSVGTNEIDLNNQASGIYFVQLTQNNQSKIVKLVKN